MTNLRFVNVVWGEEYTDAFVKVCLPSTLSANNLRYVGAQGRSTYTIYTTPKDGETIARSPAGRQLAKMMSLDIVRIDAAFPIEDPRTNQSCPQKYGAMSLCHTHFIKRYGNDGSAMVFLSPDLVCADGMLRRLFEIARSGKRLVMMCALRLAKESFIADLQRNHCKDGTLPALGGRQLVATAMNHLHPETESLIWGSPTSNVWPSLNLWRAQPEGLILRAFHLHPLLVQPSQRDILPAGTLDDDYVARACPNPNDEYIVQDSDDIVGFELTRRAARAESLSPLPHDAARVGQWARSHANARHQRFFRHPIRLHSTDITDSWRDAEDRSARAAREIDSSLAQASASAAAS